MSNEWNSSFSFFLKFAQKRSFCDHLSQKSLICWLKLRKSILKVKRAPNQHGCSGANAYPRNLVYFISILNAGNIMRANPRTLRANQVRQIVYIFLGSGSPLVTFWVRGRVRTLQKGSNPCRCTLWFAHLLCYSIYVTHLLVNLEELKIKILDEKQNKNELAPGPI